MNLKRFGEIILLLAAIAGIAALFVSIFQLQQSSESQRVAAELQATVSANQATSIASQATMEANQRAANASLATSVVLADKQLAIQKTIAAVQVQPQGNAIGTPVADVLTQLKATSDAIENQRRMSQATQTALARPLPTVPLTTCPQYFLDQNGVPQNSTTMSVKVDTGTIHVMSSGPICVAGTCLPGGEKRGSVVILLPSVTPYFLTGLIPPFNWHGACYGSTDQWKVIADERSAVMKNPYTNNCIDGKGCAVIDVLVVSGSSIIAQYSQ